MAYTQADIDVITEAIKGGVLTVRHADGRSVTFQSIAELRKARKEMIAEVNRANGSKRRRTVRVYQSGRGY